MPLVIEAIVGPWSNNCWYRDKTIIFPLTNRIFQSLLTITTIFNWADTTKSWTCSFVWCKNLKKKSNEIHNKYTGRNDWSHRVPCWTCHGLCPNGYTRYQKSTKISKQSSPGKLFYEQFINQFFFVCFFPSIPTPWILQHFNIFFYFYPSIYFFEKKNTFHFPFFVQITFGFSFFNFKTPFSFIFFGFFHNNLTKIIKIYFSSSYGVIVVHVACCYIKCNKL